MVRPGRFPERDAGRGRVVQRKQLGADEASATMALLVLTPPAHLLFCSVLLMLAVQARPRPLGFWPLRLDHVQAGGP